MRSTLIFIMLAIAGCEEARVPSATRLSSLESGERPRSEKDDGWIQEKSGARATQSSSSFAFCYCFPYGDHCAYGVGGGTRQPPDDLPACVEGEVCSGDPLSYDERFTVATGQCHRLCYHKDARIPTGLLEKDERFLQRDCAADEECRLIGVLNSFEWIPQGKVGMCFPEFRAEGRVEEK